MLDHHQAPERLPEVEALVNPNRQDDLSGLGHLCAAGVVFLALVATRAELRRRGAWGSRGGEPDLLAALELVALATVADVVPLQGLNRAFVRQGLAILRGRARPGLAALMDVAGLDGPVQPWHLGFLLGPRINAGGRIGDAGLGARLLLTADDIEARGIAAELNRLNQERQEIERQAVIEAGISVYENTPMVGLDAGDPSRIRTPAGEITAREVVLATNIELAKRPDVKAHVSVFSSFALMTEPAPDRLAAMGWNGDEGLADMRMFVHYFRRTVDGRVLMGSGSGPIAFAANTADPSLTTDTASAVRAEKGLRRLLPGLGDVGIAKIWGGGIDVSSDRLPFFRTVPGTRIHFGCGYSGHGVNPTYIGGQCLASLVLGAKDDWAGLPLCTRTLPSLPPEPFRAVGGRLVRWGIIGCEEAEERDHVAGPAMRAAAAIPKLFGLRIGTR